MGETKLSSYWPENSVLILASASSGAAKWT